MWEVDDQEDPQNNNSACERANGPLCPNEKYFGYLDDAFDYFYIKVPGKQKIIVDLFIDTGQGVDQLQLDNEKCNSIDLPIDDYYDGKYHVEYTNGPTPENYRIVVYRKEPYDPDQPYTLIVTFPK